VQRRIHLRPAGTSSKGGQKLKLQNTSTPVQQSCTPLKRGILIQNTGEWKVAPTKQMVGQETLRVGILDTISLFF